MEEESARDAAVGAPPAGADEPLRAPELLHEPRVSIHQLNAGALYALGGIVVALLAYGVFRSVIVAVLAAPVGAVGVWALHERIGRGASSLFFASGHTTPHPTEYSLARSLATRGDIDAAIETYEAAIAADPGDPQPYLEIARLQRDAKAQPAEALVWLRRARGAQRLTRGLDALIVRELAELCEFRLHEPLRASADLAQLARSHAGTPEGDWARLTLERIRAEARAALKGEGPQAPEA